jgi:ribosome modulation factor
MISRNRAESRMSDWSPTSNSAGEQRFLADTRGGHQLAFQSMQQISLRCGNIAHATRCTFMSPDRLKSAYDAGLQCGQSISGLPGRCPFERGETLSERIAWLSGFSVGKAVKHRKP